MEKIGEKIIIRETINTKFGYNISLFFNDNGLIKIDFDKGLSNTKVLSHKYSFVTRMLSEYFKGEKVDFNNIPIVIEHFSDFGKLVLKECRKIPYGEVISYKELAKRVGNERAFRAVGNILGKNPIPIVIPCHRVIGCDGKLHGYTGGVFIKEALLRLERAI